MACLAGVHRGSGAAMLRRPRDHGEVQRVEPQDGRPAGRLFRADSGMGLSREPPRARLLSGARAAPPRSPPSKRRSSSSPPPTTRWCRCRRRPRPSRSAGEPGSRPASCRGATCRSSWAGGPSAASGAILRSGSRNPRASGPSLPPRSGRASADRTRALGLCRCSQELG